MKRHRQAHEINMNSVVITGVVGSVVQYSRVTWVGWVRFYQSTPRISRNKDRGLARVKVFRRCLTTDLRKLQPKEGNIIV